MAEQVIESAPAPAPAQAAPRSDTATSATTGQAPTGASGPPAGNPMADMLFMLLPMAILMYVFFIRPENKRRKEKESLLGSMKTKDKVITIGGLHGTVSEVDGDDVVLLVDPKKDVKLRFRRSAIDQIVSPDNKEAEKK